MKLEIEIKKALIQGWFDGYVSYPGYLIFCRKDLFNTGIDSHRIIFKRYYL